MVKYDSDLKNADKNIIHCEIKVQTMLETENFTMPLIEQLNKCAEQFSAENNGLLYESKTTYKNQYEAKDNIVTHNVDFYYNNYIVRFSYHPHPPISLAHSVLTCSVSFSKTDNEKVFYPLSDIYGFLSITPFSALTIPMILSAESMSECFHDISSALKQIICELDAISYDTTRKQDLFNECFRFACTYFKQEFESPEEIKHEIECNKDQFYQKWIHSTYDIPLSAEAEASAKSTFEQICFNIYDKTQDLLSSDKKKFLQFYFEDRLTQSVSSAYESYMIGDYHAAIKLFKRQKYKTNYENLLLDYMSKAKSPERHVPESIFENLTQLYRNGISKNNLKESLAVGPAMILFGALWVPVFLIVYFGFYCLESQSAIYLLGPLENAPSIILPSLLMGITMIYFCSTTFYKLFFKKNYKKLLALQKATYSRSTHRFMKGFSAVVLVGSVIFLFFTVHCNIKLTENGFYDNTAFFTVKGTFYPYEDVDKLLYQIRTPDGHGSSYPYPSYVILLKNGDRIEMNQFDSCNETFLNIMRDKNVKIE